jgi:hypothetical protein
VIVSPAFLLPEPLVSHLAKLTAIRPLLLPRHSHYQGYHICSHLACAASVWL